MMNKIARLMMPAAMVLTSHLAACAQLSFESNKPMGTAQGIKPGRVTWVRDTLTTLWDGHSGQWWNEGNIDQERLEDMYAKSVKALTGMKSEKKAWRALFRYFNKQHGNGEVGYKPGELIAVKVNLNNTYMPDDRDNDIDQSPQATIALIRQLTEQAGVRQQDIMIYDATIGWRVRALPRRLYEPVHELFPEVRWMSANGGDGVEPAYWQEGAITYTDPRCSLGNALPKAVVEAKYMINVALLKGHEITGATMCAKNHFGSIQFPPRMHGSTTVEQFRGKEGDYSAYVDLMGLPNLGGKTMLYIVDGLYGMQTNVGAPRPDRDKWSTLGGGWSASYFMSLDPVAIESVGLDFLYAQFGDWLGFSGAPQFKKGASRNCDNYLKQAALGVNATFGAYRPNGHTIGSLGVFEHWNNAQERKYSRNLGRSEGIELYEIK